MKKKIVIVRIALLAFAVALAGNSWAAPSLRCAENQQLLQQRRKLCRPCGRVSGIRIGVGQRVFRLCERQQDKLIA
jgi:hypothetical protein